MKFETALNLIKKTKEDYSKIAADFSRTRSWLWSEFFPWKDLVKNNNNVLDFGCGNGRLIEIFKGKTINYTGVDLSAQLIKIAKERYKGYNFQVIDERVFKENKVILAFPGGYFNIIFCIATLQHIPSKKLRLALLKEFYRILAPNGHLVLTVWNLKRPSFLKYLIKFTISKIFAKINIDFGDIFIPYTTADKKIKIERYLHVFTKRGLGRMVKNAGFGIEKIYYSGGKRNLILILKK